MRRAAIAIGANLAEGSGRASKQDFARFVSIAIGSASELEAQILLASDVGLVASDSASRLAQRVDDVRRMLNGLHRRLSTKY
jgi:four helix bundle protein